MRRTAEIHAKLQDMAKTVRQIGVESQQRAIAERLPESEPRKQPLTLLPTKMLRLGQD